ncbi:acetate/propionate family kinase [Candidatus Saccharibacteria bacterium]|nr:acetate/propionate family kinase [Candidatus Saccharibacteria bacterium]
MSKLFLITNPGSASRKYALYDGEDLMAQFHFEYEGKKVVCTIKDVDDGNKKIKPAISDLNDAITILPKILADEQYVTGQHKLEAVVVRIVAPGDYFTEDHIVDEEYMKQLKEAEKRNPVHVPTTANEIRGIRECFKGVKIISISDSAFHWEKPDTYKYYSFDTELADKYEIKRYGYHGLSYAYISRYMKEQGILPEKLVVMHLGSGSSVSAILNGKAMDNSMGYTPLEGLAMSTRVGTIDAAAALNLKKALKISSDEEFLLYLNKKCGLLGLSGLSDDMREVIQARDEGDLRASLAHSIFVYRIQSYVGQMAATLGGIDALVFAGTIGERSDEIRRFVTQKMGYLGFKLDENKNLAPEFTGRYALISTNDSKPIYIVFTDETAQMIYRAQKFLKGETEEA